MPLLPGVFLRDLQFDGLVCVRHGAEERRGRLAYLEIDRAIFDLNDDVVFELSVERMEGVVGGAGAARFRVAPIPMIVVHQRPPDHDSSTPPPAPRPHLCRAPTPPPPQR